MADDNKSKGCCKPTPKWCCTFEGILKIIEFIIVFLAWLICCGVYERIDDPHVTQRFIWFLVIGIICWVFLFIIILLYGCGCFNRYISTALEKKYGWYIFMLTFSLVWFFFWLFAAVLLVSYHSYWNGLIAAAFFGIISFILFFIDSVTYYRICRKYRVQIRKLHRNLLEEEANNS